MAKAETSSSTSRRLLLGAMAAVQAAAAYPAVAVATDPHVRWWREHESLRHRATKAGLGDLPLNRIFTEQDRLLDLIADTPAMTLSGIMVQMQVARIGFEWEPTDVHWRAIESAISGLRQLAARA